LSEVLEAVESSPPVDAVDAVTGKLAADLGAERVTFLIANLAGRAVVRLSAMPIRRGQRRAGQAWSRRRLCR
jgi:hypothetical protein